MVAVFHCLKRTTMKGKLDKEFSADKCLVCVLDKAISNTSSGTFFSFHCSVIVRVGSSKMWPEANNSALQEGKEPSRDYFKDMGFEIDWTRFRWVSVMTIINWTKKQCFYCKCSACGAGLVVLYLFSVLIGWFTWSEVSWGWASDTFTSRQDNHSSGLQPSSIGRQWKRFWNWIHPDCDFTNHHNPYFCPHSQSYYVLWSWGEVRIHFTVLCILKKSSVS